jgi:tripartite-type tricarboxylate transporter receptor subunit TctC
VGGHVRTLQTTVSFLSLIILHTVSIGGLTGAQRLPQGPVSLIVTFPLDGPTDEALNTLVDSLSGALSHSVLVDYRPEESSILATQRVAAAEPDGLTFGLVNTDFVVSAALGDQLPYDTAADFDGVAQVWSAPFLLYAHRDVRASTIEELLAWARIVGGVLPYTSSGERSASHVAMELFKHFGDIELYYRAPPTPAYALDSVATGRNAIVFAPFPIGRSYVEEGRLRVIAAANAGEITGYSEAVESLPEVFPGFSVTSFVGIIAPEGTPSSAISAMSSTVASLLDATSVRTKFDALGMTRVGSTPAEFDRFLAYETATWKRLIADSGAVVAN